MPFSFYRLIVPLLLCAACGGSQAIRKTEVPEDFHMVLERTVCYGRCPAYTLEVDAEGLVQYSPVRFAPEANEVTLQLNNRKLKTLVYLIQQADIFQYEDRYDNPNISDLPATHLNCKLGEREKKLMMRVNSPAALDTLVMDIEKLLFKRVK